MSGRHGPGSRTGSNRVPGAVGLSLRQVRADPWVSLLLAVLVALAALLVTLGPRLVTDLNSRQVDYTLRELSVLQRDVRSTVVASSPPLSGSAGQVGVFDPPEQTWAAVTEGLQQVRADQPEPLRSLLQTGRFYVDVDPPRLAPDDPDSQIAEIELQYRVDPRLPEMVRLVEGDWPAPTVPLPEVGADSSSSSQVGPGGELEILLSADAAEQLVWDVGEVRDVAAAAPTRLAGIYTPVDPENSYWDYSTHGAELSTFFDGDRGTLATAAAYLYPGNPGIVTPLSTREFQLWYPLDASNVPGDDVGALTRQLGALTAAQVPIVGSDEDNSDPTVVALRAGFGTEIFGVLGSLADQQRSTASILAVIAAGPVGVALAVFALSARLIITRRRSALTLASARGGSDRQIRGVLAVEGVLLGLPAAALGYVVAGLIVPPLDPWPWTALLVAFAIALTPAAALALTSSALSARETRSDLGSQGAGGRVRWIAEIALVALAALAVWRLLDRGLTGVSVSQNGQTAPSSSSGASEVGTGVDVLMAATPVLLALAAAVVMLRLYPVPLRALTRALHARTSLSPFLGAARALRDPAGGLLPALAMILGIAVATSSAVLASTVTDGAQSSAWAETGADIRLSGPRVTDDLVSTVTSVPGVVDVAAVNETSRPVNVTGDGADARSVTVYLVDDALIDVQASAPLVSSLPAEVYGNGSPLPVVTGGDLSPTDGEINVSGVGPARVIGHVDELPGVSTSAKFLVTTRSAWEAAGGTTTPSTVALVSVDTDTDREVVAQAVAQAVPNSSVETPQARLDAFGAAPVTSGLTDMFGVAVLVTTALTVLAIVLVQAIASPSRIRLLAVLRTLGAGRRQARALTGWELAPMLTMAFVVGGLLGVAVPWLLLQAVALSGLTGSTTQPDLSINPLTLGPVVLGVLIAIILAVVVSAAVASRTNPAQQVRLSEER